MSEAIRTEAAFLLERLHEINLDDDADDLIRDWNGHVEPSIARLRGLLASPPPQPQMVAIKSALEFYRDAFQFHPKRGPTGVDHSEWKPKPILIEDCGNRAIEALAALAKLEDQP